MPLVKLIHANDTLFFLLFEVGVGVGVGGLKNAILVKVVKENSVVQQSVCFRNDAL